MEKGGDPTRFYTEGGTIWFINNAAYSGKLLWPKSGNAVKWQFMKKEFGHDLATDMVRYLGYLGSPKYTVNNLKGRSTEDQREILGAALAKTKYFIRLIDAYEIGHDQGNKIYNDRINQRQKTGDDASYHLQIYNDAVKMVAAQASSDPNNVITAADLPMIKRIAQMKMKGDFDSPWKVIEAEGYTEDAAIAEAHKTMEWMRVAAPKILAKLANDYHGDIMEHAKHEDVGERNEAMASTMRMMLVQRNIMTLDSPDAIPLIVSKIKDGKILTREEHEIEIRNSVLSSTTKNHVSQDIQKKIDEVTAKLQAKEDSQKEIDAYLSSIDLTNANVPASELSQFSYENLFKPMFDYMVYISNAID